MQPNHLFPNAFSHAKNLPSVCQCHTNILNYSLNKLPRTITKESRFVHSRHRVWSESCTLGTSALRGMLTPSIMNGFSSGEGGKNCVLRSLSHQYTSDNLCKKDAHIKNKYFRQWWAQTTLVMIDQLCSTMKECNKNKCTTLHGAMGEKKNINNCGGYLQFLQPIISQVLRKNL